MDKKDSSAGICALKKAASAAGIVAGIAGTEHGFFEMLQGNNTINAHIIDAIGPAQRFWLFGTEPAFTLIPNFLITGIIAAIAGIMLIIWSAAFIGKKYSALTISGLSVVMFLTGGGFAPPVFALAAIISVLLMKMKHRFLRKYCPEKIINFLSKPWKIILILFITLSSIEIVNAVFGFPLIWFIDQDNVTGALTVFGYITFFAVGPLAIITSLANDIKEL